MNIKFEITSDRRKDLANAIAEYYQTKAKYTMPGFRYVIGDKAEVLKDCSVNYFDDQPVGYLLDYLLCCGFNSQEEKEPDKVEISLPDDLTDRQFMNLKSLISGKQTLMVHAFQTEEISVTRKDGKLNFHGFQCTDGEHVQAYMKFVCGLVKLAKTAKQVRTTNHDVPNEKYAFRCFLVRLGMVGTDDKKDRKVLLENLAGSSAFRDGKKKEKEPVALQ